MMRLVICIVALPALARGTRANTDEFAWPWDQDNSHAKPHHIHQLSNMMATRTQTRSHDFGASWDSSSFGDDSTQNTGDFMDQYISETGQKPMQITADKPAPKHEDDVPDMATLFGEDNTPKKPERSSFDSDSRSSSSDATAAFTSDMTNMFGASQFGSDHGFDMPAPAPARATPAVDSSSDGDSGWPWSGHNKRRGDMESHSGRSLWDSDSNAGSSSSTSGSNSITDTSASDSFSKMFGSWSNNAGSSWSSNDYSKSNSDASASLGSDVSMPQHAPQDQDNAGMDNRPADSPIQGPTQRESSLAGASAQDQVVDVRLSSELQQSLLQARNAETKMLQRFRGVSN